MGDCCAVTGGPVRINHDLPSLIGEAHCRGWSGQPPVIDNNLPWWNGQSCRWSTTTCGGWNGQPARHRRQLAVDLPSPTPPLDLRHSQFLLLVSSRRCGCRPTPIRIPDRRFAAKRASRRQSQKASAPNKSAVPGLSRFPRLGTLRRNVKQLAAPAGTCHARGTHRRALKPLSACSDQE